MNREINKMKPTFDVYVGHVPQSVEENKLYGVFSKFGEIVNIFCRYNRGSIGYAIVKFKHKKDADKVLKEIETICVEGHDMEVRHAMRSQVYENGCDLYGNPGLAEPPTPGIYPMRSMPSYGEQLYEPIPPPVMENQYMHPPQHEKSGKQVPVMIEVMCTSVENATTFYGCPIFRWDELHNLSLKLNSMCPNLMHLLRKPTENQMYGTLYGEDMCWYRCVMIQSTLPAKPGMCLVRYVDYGNVDQVHYNSLVELPDPVKRISMFAVKCVLSNLVCNPKSHCDVSYLHHLVNQRMSLCAMSSWGVPQYNVIKCLSNGIDVISELVRNGFAVYKSQTPPEVKTDMPKPVKTVKFQDSEKQHKGANRNRNTKKSKAKANGHIEERPTDGANISLERPQHFITENGHTVAKNNNVPKKIIKRGSDINQFTARPASETAKAKDKVNHLLKIDSVLSTLKLVNNVRGYVPLTNEDNLISGAVKFLLNDADVKVDEDSINNVKEAHRVYSNTLDEIKNCSDQGLLTELKIKRELQKEDLCSKLSTFLETFDVSALEKQKIIQKMIMDLESNCNAWMNVYLPHTPSSTDELMEIYTKEKEKRYNEIQTARENVNEQHKKFMEFLEDFRKEFSLNLTGVADNLSSSEGKKGSLAVKFEEALTNLKMVLEQEQKTYNVAKRANCVPVIQCILDKIDSCKEKIDAKCEIYEKYKLLYSGLVNMTDLKQVFDDLTQVQQEILQLTSAAQSSNEEVNVSHFSLLHNALQKENTLLETLAKASALHFPELILECPELSLLEYKNNLYLLKPSWKSDFFPVLEKCIRVEPSCISKFGDQSVIIKEFAFEDELKKASFTKKAIVWNEIKSKHLTKVEAMFNKDNKTLCAMLPHTSPTLMEKPLPISADRKAACNVLQRVLNGLKDIHARGMAHGAVHPLAVLHDDSAVMLDFNYDLRLTKDDLIIKGINFQIPDGEEAVCKSADMYGFGCLVLWVLFPNLSFTTTEKGLPNLFAFQSILQELLSVKDFDFLAKLVNDNKDLRPSSTMLLSSSFLKDLRISADSVIS